MPITAKLSRRFYEQFGDDVVNELVTLLNNVDANSRSDLKELNEANFARFDAKSEANFARFEAKSEANFARFEAKSEARFARFDTKLDQVRSDLDAKLERRIGELRVEVHALKAELIKWMFLFFTGSALANILLK